MKRSLLLALSIAVIVSSFGLSSASAHPRHSRVNRNEAQHLVLAKYPGATINRCKLQRGKGHPVWVLDVAKQGAKTPMQVRVDGRSGRIL